MNIKRLFLILIILLLSLQIVAAAENEYGIVRAWFNGQNATANGIQLRIGEPSELKIDVISKIDGNVYIKILEPGTTKAFDVISGPSKQDERIDNLGVVNGWSRTLTWIITPNGAWKNGNAPINIFVEFSKIKTDKKIQFTVANPYILDEQYTGAVSTPKPTSSSMETAPSTPAKPTPFPSALFAIAMLLLAACKVRRR
jgi:sarcinarray family protein